MRNTNISMSSHLLLPLSCPVLSTLMRVSPYSETVMSVINVFSYVSVNTRMLPCRYFSLMPGLRHQLVYLIGERSHVPHYDRWTSRSINFPPIAVLSSSSAPLFISFSARGRYWVAPPAATLCYRTLTPDRYCKQSGPWLLKGSQT